MNSMKTIVKDETNEEEEYKGEGEERKKNWRKINRFIASYKDMSKVPAPNIQRWLMFIIHEHLSNVECVRYLHLELDFRSEKIPKKMKQTVCAYTNQHPNVI